MIVPDVNLLVYAYRASAPEHRAARTWWEECCNGGAEVGVPLPVLFGFIRLVTNPRVFDVPLSVAAAVGAIESWLALPRVRPLTPGPRHLDLAFGLLRATGTAGNLTTDAQLAALAMENQAELHSTDTDFGRFPGLKWVNPLARPAKRKR